MIRMRTARLSALLLAVIVVSPAPAKEKAKQQAMPEMTPEQMAEMAAYQKAGTPGAPQAGLAKASGTYDLTIRTWHEPGAEAMVEKGTGTRTMTLGGRVLVEDVKATMMGQPFTGHAMMGYDNVSEKYWSTWNDSMSTGLMVSEGTCDAAAACSFTGSWMDPIKKTKVTSRMTTRWTNADTEVFEMFTPGRDGKEMKMMEITYVRKP